jgi:hypothetical protein
MVETTEWRLRGGKSAWSAVAKSYSTLERYEGSSRSFVPRRTIALPQGAHAHFALTPHHTMESVSMARSASSPSSTTAAPSCEKRRSRVSPRAYRA